MRIERQTDKAQAGDDEYARGDGLKPDRRERRGLGGIEVPEVLPSVLAGAGESIIDGLKKRPSKSPMTM